MAAHLKEAVGRHRTKGVFMNAAIIYWFETGNTEKVALAIKESPEANGTRVTSIRAEEAHDLEVCRRVAPAPRTLASVVSATSLAPGPGKPRLPD
jgi:hypothetical protein